MSASSPAPLQSFHDFVAGYLATASAESISPEDAILLWRAREQSIAELREGLDDIEAGRTKSLEEFDRDFLARHRLEAAP